MHILLERTFERTKEQIVDVPVVLVQQVAEEILEETCVLQERISERHRRAR